MKRSALLLFISALAVGSMAQDLEIKSSSDWRQPGNVNPALAGLKEDVFRVLSNTDLNNYTLMLEGRLPFKLGNYMMGVQRTSNDYVSDNMFNLTYGRTSKKNKNFHFRYGGSLEFHSRSSIKTDGDSVLFAFTDLDGKRREFSSLSELTGELSYVNIDFGASINYNNLLMAVSLNNAFSPDVSLLQAEQRELPLQLNACIGGFIKLAENYTFFPSFIGVYQNNNFLAQAGVELYTKHINVAARYSLEELRDELTASIATHYKRTYVGLSYTQALSESGNPEFKVFLNSSLFKSPKWLKSKFAKDISKFY